MKRIDDLQLDGLKIIQNKDGYCFTSDSVVLANFVKAKHNDFCIEIGSGSGVISTLVQHKNNLKNVVGFEIQSTLSNNSIESIALNNKQDFIRIINDKAQNFANYFPKHSADVVFSNPPYRKQNESCKSLNEELCICKHEKEINLQTLCRTAYEMLKFGGKFYIVYDANRSAELIYELKLNKLEPKKMFFTQPAIDSKAILIVIEAIHGGKEGVNVLPTLITNDKDGNYINNIKSNYKEK